MDFRWSPKLDTEAFTETGYWAASQDEIEQQKRAAAVIDWLENGVPDSSEESDQRIGEYLARLDELIRANLDRDSIWDFVYFAADYVNVLAARDKAARRWNDDPIQVARNGVRDYWLLWKDEPSRYASKAEFARDMQEKIDSITSARTVETWCRRWERGQE